MTDRIPTWTLQRMDSQGWTDVVSETSIPAIRARHAEHTKADPRGMYRTVRSDETTTPKEN